MFKNLTFYEYFSIELFVIGLTGKSNLFLRILSLKQRTLHADYNHYANIRDPHRHVTAVNPRETKNLPDHPYRRYFLVESDLDLCPALSPLMEPKA